MVARPVAIALVDVRCMFVSVERVLDPALRDRPVIVLSNNDGCAVSRSEEAKRLGIRLGDPWYQLRERPGLREVVARSSHYEEYGAFSSRFHDTVATSALATEVYSVDEAFVDLPRRSSTETTQEIQERVLRWTALPTAAGVGPTKTLAKVAQRHAKDLGVDLVDLSGWPAARLDELLAATPTAEVWGIGRRLSAGLAGLGIHTAYDLARADPGVLRRRWSVVLERTARELAGVPCVPVGFAPRDRHQLIHSRMFGTPVSSRAEMASALAQYAAHAARRLRAHGLDAAGMQVWISSSRFRAEVAHHTVPVALDPPTSDPLRLIAATRVLLPHMREGWPYNRAGVMLTQLTPAGSQPTLIEPDPTREALAAAVDRIAHRYGRQSVGWGPTGVRAANRWDMRRELLSPYATARWDRLPTAR